MAQRRMFSLQIVDTDAFMDMPLSSQALYFHLGMRADDDGFVSNARRIQKLVGASDDDLRLLVLKRFVLVFDSGVIVIKHWKISNYIQKDRYRPTLYKEEKATLYLKPDGSYTDHPFPGAVPCLPPPAEGNQPAEISVVSNLDTLDTDCIHRLGKDRLGKDRLGKVKNSLSGGDGTRTGACEDAAEREVAEYLQERQLDPALTFGVTQDLMDSAALLAGAIFKRFTTRRPTEADIANVFMCVRQQEYNDTTGQWQVNIPSERKKLLMYAFEQAALSGRAGDWKYINGILAKLHQRGIQTLDEAEGYDYERDFHSEALRKPSGGANG